MSIAELKKAIRSAEGQFKDLFITQEELDYLIAIAQNKYFKSQKVKKRNTRAESKTKTETMSKAPPFTKEQIKETGDSIEHDMRKRFDPMYCESESKQEECKHKDTRIIEWFDGGYVEICKDCGMSRYCTEHDTMQWEHKDFAQELSDNCGMAFNESIEQNEFMQRLYEMCPEFKKEEDIINTVESYFLSYDMFLEKIGHAWNGARFYNNDPLELIVDLINERDEALENKKKEECKGHEFCKAVECRNFFQDATLIYEHCKYEHKKDVKKCIYSVKEFQRWLKENNYRIIKRG